MNKIIMILPANLSVHKNKVFHFVFIISFITAFAVSAFAASTDNSKSYLMADGSNAYRLKESASMNFVSQLQKNEMWSTFSLSGHSFDAKNIIKSLLVDQIAPAHVAEIAVSLPNSTAFKGTIVEIPVSVGDLTGANIEAFDFSVFYDAAILQPTTMITSTSETLSQNCSTLANSPASGRATISVTCPTLHINFGSGTLINLQFNVIGISGQQSHLSFINPVNNQNTFQFNDAMPVARPTNGVFTVLGSTATPTPTVTPTVTPSPIATPTPIQTPFPTPAGTPITTPTPISGRVNVALAANGGYASASSHIVGNYPSTGIDGVKNWATSGAWKDATPDTFPDWLQVDFNASRTINEIDVYSVTDNYSMAIDPNENTTFSVYGLTNFYIQYWNGSNWITVQNGNVVNNNKAITKILFPSVTTDKIRVVIINALSNYSRIVEVEAWTGSGTISNPTPTSTPISTPTPSTPTPTPVATPNSTRTNVALASNGGFASASSQLPGGAPSIAVDGVKNWATTGTWKDATPDSYPDWLQVDFNGNKTINEIDVYSVTDDFSNPTNPNDASTFNYYGVTSLNVQYWNGSSWVTVQNGNLVNNNKTVAKIVFSAITTNKIRVVVNNAQANYSRIVELEAWTSGGTVSNPPPTPTPNSTPTPTPSTPTPTPTPGVRTNVALASNGGFASASSEFPGGYSPSIAINGGRTWAFGGGWKDATTDNYPDWLQVDFNGSKTINEINVYAVTDDFLNATEPTINDTFSVYGITNFNVQYWNGSAWITVPNGNVSNTNKVVTKLVFSPVSTTKIRVVVNNAQASYSRIVEVEAWQ
jgi:hypothetical protein